MSMLAVSSLCAVSSAGATPAPASAKRCSRADRTPASMNGSTATHATLCLLNRERATHGLRPLRLDRKLARAARGHAGDMVAHHYFAHDSRSGASFSTRIKRTGWTRSRRSWTVSENLGIGSGPLSTPRTMVRAWMHSPGHRANILTRNFRLIGIGVAGHTPAGGTGATYATDFGG